MASKKLNLLGKKRGMVQLFDQNGSAFACTVIEAHPHVVAQIKSKEKDGYDAVQLAYEKIEANDDRTVARRAKKPLKGHYDKAGVVPHRYLRESRLDDVSEYSVGQEINIGVFADVAHLDITAFSKGKGYQGLMKLKNYAGGPASHGSGFHRHAGSTGMRSSPGRCFKGGPRPSHMGYDVKTVQNLSVFKVDVENHLIIVKGAVPGPNDGLVTLTPAVKQGKRA